MVRQHREEVVIEEQRQRRIMSSSAAPSPSSSPTSNKNSSDDDSNSISPSSQDSNTPSSTQPDAYLDDATNSSPPPPSKAPPPNSPPPSSPPPPQSSPPPKSNPPPKTSPSPPPPSPESESPPPESSEPPTTTKSPPESPQSDFVPPPPPPSQSGSMQTLMTTDSYSPRPPSSSTSPPTPGKTPSSSPPPSSNDSPPPPPIPASASLFSQYATDATPNSSKSPTKSPSPSGTSSSSSSNGTSNSTPTPSSPNGTASSSSSNGTSNSTPTSSSRNGTASPSNETSNSTTASSSSSSPPPPSDQHAGAVEGAIVGAVAGVLIILLIGLLFLCIKRKRKRVGPYANSYHPPPNFPIPPDQKNYYGQTMVFSGEYGYAPNSSGSQQGGSNMYHGVGGGEIGGSKSIFSYEELMEITSGFSRQNIIGEGGFGCVFRGQLPDGREVAVKQLKAGSGQGEREFRAEVEIISRVHHRHLVSLVGYCIAEHRRLLIYEFVPNNTLEHHLHGNAMPVLEWTKRLKIALGSAKGLAYLHEDCHPKIIHRDIKSANILLDDAFEAQVADFGLAKLTNDAHTHVSTRVMGTFGYLAPEYASSGKLTDRSDVFSFGVVLLELLTGRKPVDSSQPLGDESLVEWARPRLVKALESGDFSELVDPRLGKSYVENELVRMMEAAVACIRHSAPKRPRMAQVVRALDCDEELSDLSNGVKYGQSMVYNSEQYSQDIIRFRRMAAGDDDSMEYESTASKPHSNHNQSSWKSPESSIGLGNSYGREIGP